MVLRLDGRTKLCYYCANMRGIQSSSRLGKRTSISDDWMMMVHFSAGFLVRSRMVKTRRRFSSQNLLETNIHLEVKKSFFLSNV